MLKAYKHETLRKMRSPVPLGRRLLEDHQVYRPDVYGGQPLELTGTNSQTLDRIDPLLCSVRLARTWTGAETALVATS